MKRLVVLVAVAATASACTTTRAAMPVERPVLEVPLPPPRVVESAPPRQLPYTEPVPPLAPEKPTTQAKPRPPARDTTSRETQKPELPKPDPAPAATTEPPPATTTPAPAPPAPALRTMATPDAASAERRIRESLGKTEGMLRNLDRRGLAAERQTAYDDARGSIDGAQAALKSANFELAQQMADKAEKLVRELQAR